MWLMSLILCDRCVSLVFFRHIIPGHTDDNDGWSLSTKDNKNWNLEDGIGIALRTTWRLLLKLLYCCLRKKVRWSSLLNSQKHDQVHVIKKHMIYAPSFIHFSTLSSFLRFHQMWGINVGLRFEKCLKEFQLPCGIFLYRNTLIWVLHLHSIFPFLSFLALHFALHLHSIFLLLFMT